MRRTWVNYHHLLYFKTIAVEGGIARAAKKLRLGQPTLSTQLKQFEDALGHQLFDRSRRQLQLTEMGRLVLGYASEIFRLGDEMLDALNDQPAAARIQVQIGVVDTFPKHLTYRVFDSARKAHDCVVAFAEGHGNELLRELRAHRLDLVIANDPPAVGDAAGFYARTVAKLPVVVCGAPKFARLRKGFPGSLRGQPFIMPSQQSRLRHDFEHFLKLHDIHVDTIAEVQDTALQKLIATHGAGLVPIMQPAADELVANKELAEIGVVPGIHEEVWFVAAQRRIQNPVAATLMKNFKL